MCVIPLITTYEKSCIIQIQAFYSANKIVSLVIEKNLKKIKNVKCV